VLPPPGVDWFVGEPVPFCGNEIDDGMYAWWKIEPSLR
jgi:hypothetical protein